MSGVWIVRMVCERTANSHRYPTYTFTIYGPSEGEAVNVAIAQCRAMDKLPMSYVATPARTGLIAASVQAMTEAEFRNVHPKLTLILTKVLTNA